MLWPSLPSPETLRDSRSEEIKYVTDMLTNNVFVFKVKCNPKFYVNLGCKISHFKIWGIYFMRWERIER